MGSEMCIRDRCNLSPAGIMMIKNNMGLLTQREEDLHSEMLDMVGVANGKMKQQNAQSP